MKRSNITLSTKTNDVKKTKRGPIPDAKMEKPQYKIINNLTTTYSKTTKHKRAYLLKERDRRRLQRERTKEQNEPTETISRKLLVQNTKNKAPILQNKTTTRSGLKQTKKTATYNKNTIRKEGPSTTSLDRNQSQKWTTTKTSNKNTGTRKEEQTSTLRIGNNATIKRLSNRKRKLEDVPNIQLKTRKLQNIQT